MRKMGPQKQRWLKIVHLLFVCTWLGGGLSLVVLSYSGLPEDGDELYGYLLSMKNIDDLVIIPGAMGCLLTGLIYSVWTKWGFWKHGWVVIKWVLAVAQVLFGTFFLGPWLNRATAIAKADRVFALESAELMRNMSLNKWAGTAQVALLIVIIGISILKPLKGRLARKKQ